MSGTGPDNGYCAITTYMNIQEVRVFPTLYVCVCVCVYIYIYNIYVCMCVCACVCVCFI
jgi:hypothetical protein